MNFHQWTSQLSQDSIQQHHLSGYFHLPQWQSQFTYNHLRRDELCHVGELLQKQNISAVLLKGFALMEDTYNDLGQRFASDIDILVSTVDLDRTVQILMQLNYQVIKEKTWKGNNFKVIFSKDTHFGEITIELHTRLFWHTDQIKAKNLRASQIPGFFLLDLEEQLIHLCGHLAFQHTFLKLFWLFDIYEFVQKHKQQINFNKFWLQSRHCQLFISCYLCLCLVSADKMILNSTKLSYKESLQAKILFKLIDQKYLLSPRSYAYKYFVIKHLIKDNFRLNLSYNLFWLLQRISVLF